MRNLLTESNNVMKILVVCKGNICRSPLSEAVLNKKLNNLNLHESVMIESAAIKNYHIGKGADPNAISVGKENNYDLSSHIVKQIDLNHVRWADLIVIMDKENRDDLIELFGSEVTKKTKLLRSFIEGEEKDIIDPFKKSYTEFKKAFYMIELSCESLIDFIIKKGNGLGPPIKGPAKF